jgi:hypothetical protein
MNAGEKGGEQTAFFCLLQVFPLEPKDMFSWCINNVISFLGLDKKQRAFIMELCSIILTNKTKFGGNHGTKRSYHFAR